MRIAIDATPLIAQPTGVGTFVAGLIDSLKGFANPGLAPSKITGTNGSIEVVEYALNTPQRFRNWLKTRQNGTGRINPERHMMWLPPSVAPWMWRYLPIPVERKLGSLDVVHGTSFMVPPARSALRVVTVHDLTYLMRDEVPRRVSWWDYYVRQAIDTGAVVHTQSQYVADEVAQHYNTERIGAVRPAVEPRDPEYIAALRQGRESDPPYILALGFSQPRKRLPLLVSAFEQAYKQLSGQGLDCQLRIVGPPGLDEAAVLERIGQLPSSIRARVDRRGWVPAQERDRLLTRAAVLAFPSIYEGFGYPALEAMALEVPVVAAAAGSLPEAVGDAALLVPPDDVQALTQALVQVVSSVDLQADLKRKGKAHVVAHSPRQAAAEMLALYGAYM